MKNVLLHTDLDHLQHYFKNTVQVSLFSNCNEAEQLTSQISFDVCLFVCNQQSDETVELADFLHQHSFSTKIIAVGDCRQSAVISLLEHAVDVYIGRPCSDLEIIIRVKKAFLIEKKFQQETLHFNYATLKLGSRKVQFRDSDTTYQLSEKEIGLLHCLMLHPNQVIKRERLAYWIWGIDADYMSHGTLDVYIRRLRSKIGDHGAQIETVRGYGYVFNYQSETDLKYPKLEDKVPDTADNTHPPKHQPATAIGGGYY